MARKARPVPFARRRANSVIQNLRASPLTEWPKHLRFARKILVEELSLDEAKALSVLTPTFQAAHVCAQAKDKRSSDIAYLNQQRKVHGIFERIANCARRSPANLRRALNNGTYSAFHDRVVDEESIEILFDNLFAAFASAPQSDVSPTVLRVMFPKHMQAKLNDHSKVRSFFAESATFLKQEYAALHPIDQHKVETALTRSLNCQDAADDAANVSETIAKALDGEADRISSAIRDLVIDYVVVTADVWRQHGLKPARASNPYKEDQRSKFHRFTDLVLIAAVEPGSKRHDSNLEEVHAELRRARMKLPPDLRKCISTKPRRADTEWLVTDDDVRAALARIQKKPLRIP